MKRYNRQVSHIYIYIYKNYLALLKITTESFLFFWGSDLYSASKKTNREPPWGAAPLLLPLVNVTASLMMERISCQPPTHTHTHTHCTPLLLCALSSLPGGHVNPAVSLAMVILGKLKIWKFPFYVIAQFLGAFAGAAAVFGLYYGEASFAYIYKAITSVM